MDSTYPQIPYVILDKIIKRSYYKALDRGSFKQAVAIYDCLSKAKEQEKGVAPVG